MRNRAGGRKDSHLLYKNFYKKILCSKCSLFAPIRLYSVFYCFVSSFVLVVVFYLLYV